MWLTMVSLVQPCSRLSVSWNYLNLNGFCSLWTDIIHYIITDAPTNTVIDRQTIEVEEGSIAGYLECSASAYPLANYYWQYNHQIIGNGQRLALDYGLSRDKTGEYSCVAHNQHGNSSAKAFINVVCKIVIFFSISLLQKEKSVVFLLFQSRQYYSSLVQSSKRFFQKLIKSFCDITLYFVSIDFVFTTIRCLMPEYSQTGVFHHFTRNGRQDSADMWSQGQSQVGWFHMDAKQLYTDHGHSSHGLAKYSDSWRTTSQQWRLLLLRQQLGWPCNSLWD